MVANLMVEQHWLINERSGNGRGGKLLRDLAKVRGIKVSPINFCDLGAQIESIAPDTQIVVAGGDGTFSAVLGETSVGDRCVACVPLGTANDLTRELGISQKLGRASNQELPRLVAPLDHKMFAMWEVRIGDRKRAFANYMSIGYEGAVVSDFAKWRREARWSGRLMNRIAYTAFGARHSMALLRGLRVQTDNGEPIGCGPTTGLIITNIKSHLGLGLSNSESCPHDDVIECISVPNVFGFVSMIGASRGLLTPPSVLARGREIIISGIPENTPIQIDGESHPPISEGEIRVTLKHFVNLCAAH